MNSKNSCEKRGFFFQRFGLLIGQINDDDHSVHVDAIYEPPQEGNEEGFVELEDPKAATVDGLINLLGLQKVGWIFSRKKKPNAILTSEEVLSIAKYQLKYGNNFVTIIVELTEDGLVNFEAYQVSEQCVQLLKDDILVSSGNEKFINTRRPVEVEKKDTKEVDCSLFIITTAIVERESPFNLNFSVENRPGINSEQDFVKTMRNHKTPFSQRIKDFHFLLFITNFLNIQTDMPVLCEAINNPNESRQQLEVYEQLLLTYAGLA